MTVGIRSAPTAWITPKPSTPGICTSRNTRSGDWCWIAATACGRRRTRRRPRRPPPAAAATARARAPSARRRRPGFGSCSRHALHWSAARPASDSEHEGNDDRHLEAAAGGARTRSGGGADTGARAAIACWTGPTPVLKSVSLSGDRPTPLSRTTSSSRSPSRRAITSTRPPPTFGPMPWRTAFSTSGCSTSRHRRVERLRLDVDADLQAVAEARLLDLQILLEEVELLFQRHLLRADAGRASAAADR